MDYNPYEILGLTPNATPDEVDERYRQLRDRYQRDRFAIGEEGEEAAENLQRLEVAYRDILSRRTTKDDGDEFSESGYQSIQRLIKQNDLDGAQQALDDVDSRDAEWHYLQSIVYYKRSWYLESKKQLEFACQLEPSNQRYKDSLEKLTKILASNTISPDQLRTSSRPTDGGPNFGAPRGSCTGNICLDCMLCNLCCNCAQCGGC